MQAVKYYKCPHCGEKYKSLKVWGNHVEAKHPGLIPEGWSPARYFYFIQTGKKEGHCVECKNPTDWNDGTQKYERFCKNPACKEAYRKRFVNRMITTRGKVHLLDDPEQQRKMLAAKKISGTYAFKNGTKIPYTGTYELDFLRMLDTFLEFNPNDIMMPSPHTYYYDYKNPEDPEHEGRHFYIPDAYIPSLNLEVEIKQNTNKHPKILRIDKAKEAQKDAMMKTLPGINYIKILEKDYSGFFEFISNYTPDEKPTIATALEAYETELKNDTVEFTNELNEFFAPFRELMSGYTEDENTAYPEALEASGYAADKKNPVFILLTLGSSTLSKIIISATGDSVSHSSISLNPELDPLYSFGTKKFMPNGKREMGFIKTNPYSDLWNGNKNLVPYELYVTFVSNEGLQKMQKRLEYFIANSDKMKYSMAGLIRVFFNLKSPKKKKWFCSAFVAEILGSGGVALDRDSTLYRPMQLASLQNVELLTTGPNILEYNPDVTKKALKALITKEEHTPATEGVKFTEYDIMYNPPKEKAKLSSFNAVDLDLGIIKAMRGDVPNLKHVRADRSTYGEIFSDGKHPVGYYQTSRDENCTWIQAFEICEDYQGQGLSEQMLSRLIRKTNATNLSVDLNNELAIRLYMKNGFREYARTQKMMFMHREPD